MNLVIKSVAITLVAAIFGILGTFTFYFFRVDSYRDLAPREIGLAGVHAIDNVIGMGGPCGSVTFGLKARTRQDLAQNGMALLHEATFARGGKAFQAWRPTPIAPPLAADPDAVPQSAGRGLEDNPGVQRALTAPGAYYALASNALLLLAPGQNQLVVTKCTRRTNYR